MRVGGGVHVHMCACAYLFIRLNNLLNLVKLSAAFPPMAPLPHPASPLLLFLPKAAEFREALMLCWSWGLTPPSRAAQLPPAGPSILADLQLERNHAAVLPVRDRTGPQLGYEA